MTRNSSEDLGVIERHELLSTTAADSLASLFGVGRPDFAADEALPLLWHWVYALERPAQADLGADGHSIRGTIPAPPGPGHRRMWAGGTVSTFAPLRMGSVMTRRTHVANEATKEGRSGTLTFIAVEHELIQDGVVAVRERQDIVYRDGVYARPSLQAGPPNRQSDCQWPPTPQEPEVVPATSDEWEVPIDPTLLFRFSALTYNAHRIHYDRDYAVHVEGYPALVTHGPLQAIAMAEAARRAGIEAAVGHRFDYRLVAPLYENQGLIARCLPAGQTAHLRVRDRSGRTTATAELTRLAAPIT